MEQENITFRNKRTNISCELLEELSDHSFLSSDSIIQRSLPDISTINSREDDFLREISNLKLKLENAYKEINTLIEENRGLQKKIIELEMKINNLLLSMDKNKQKYNLSIETGETKNLKYTQENNNIWIYGDQKCIGLGARLYESRQSTTILKYNIISFTKPNASTEEILKGLHNISIVPQDKIILAVGENDRNPFDVISELHYILKKYRYYNIFVLQVLNNPYLNTVKLNSKLKLICNQFKNCKFIQLDQVNFKNIDICKYLCNRLNFNIDSIDYNVKFIRNRQFLTKNLTGARNACIKTHYPHWKDNKTLQCKDYKQIKGTIDYYFSKLNSVKTEVKSNIMEAKKGTIPFYFPQIKKKLAPLDSNNCFRS